MKTKSFKYWLTQQLHEQFGLARLPVSPLLDAWLTTTEPITEAEQTRLERLRIDLLANADYWNEEELKVKFIGQLLDLVQLEGPTFRTFYDRPLSATLNGTRLYGTVDMVVATGFQIPTEPFFCIHEYKQEGRREGDPKGQLLAAMLVAQTLNTAPHPVYGCYVLGRNWFFVVLKGTEYAISDAYVATQSDLLAIFQALRFIRRQIETWLAD
ncbi:MAG: hypothetical protein EAZ91_21740 [Cytophagales bacterium]|nr:MAG: hypothetical protein EAZ91_21740 [Cytophagales bacterium]